MRPLEKVVFVSFRQPGRRKSRSKCCHEIDCTTRADRRFPLDGQRSLRAETAPPLAWNTPIRGGLPRSPRQLQALRTHESPSNAASGRAAAAIFLSVSQPRVEPLDNGFWEGSTGCSSSMPAPPPTVLRIHPPPSLRCPFDQIQGPGEAEIERATADVDTGGSERSAIV